MLELILHSQKHLLRPYSPLDKARCATCHHLGRRVSFPFADQLTNASVQSSNGLSGCARRLGPPKLVFISGSRFKAHCRLLAQVKARLLAAKNLLLKLRSSGSSSSSPSAASRQRAACGNSSQLQSQDPPHGCQMVHDAKNPFLPLPMRPVRQPNLPSAHSSHHRAAQDIQPAVHAGMAGQNPDDDYDGVCVICLEAAPAVIFQPCLHAVACAACASKVAARNNECPMCRCPVHAALPLTSSS